MAGLAVEVPVGRYGEPAVSSPAIWYIYHITATDMSMGAAFLCADLASPPPLPEARDDHAAYIGHSPKALKEDSRLIFSAVAHEQCAVDFLRCQIAGNKAMQQNGILN